MEEFHPSPMTPKAQFRNIIVISHLAKETNNLHISYQKWHTSVIYNHLFIAVMLSFI